jgi:GntR family transcriptional repressor for pyruvate dehydrogenase complex
VPDGVSTGEQRLSDLPDVLLRPVRGHHAFETCVGQLAAAIRLGVFPWGTALPPERELAERMSVSRATLREAIVALRAADMVTTARGRGGGTTVCYRPTTPDESGAVDQPGIAERADALVDSLHFRRVAEPGACYLLAARGLSAADRATLSDLERAVREAPDNPERRQADSRLHLAIAAGTGSRLILDAVTTVQADLHEMLSAIPVLDRNIAHSHRQHAAIVSAILAGDPTTARRAMEQHCDDTAALLAGLLGLPFTPVTETRRTTRSPR